jgi:hypothetical protein
LHSRQNHGACVRSAIVLCRDEQTRTRRCHPALAHGSALGKATTTRRAFSAVAPDMSQFGAGVALRPQRLQFEAGFNHQAASEKPLVRPGLILWWSRRRRYKDGTWPSPYRCPRTFLKRSFPVSWLTVHRAARCRWPVVSARSLLLGRADRQISGTGQPTMAPAWVSADSSAAVGGGSGGSP